MKKKLALVLAAAMLLVTPAGCGRTDRPAPEGSSSSASGSQAEAEELKAAVFYYSFEDPYLSTVRTAMDQELTDLGVSYENFDAGASQAVQDGQIAQALEQGFNLFILNIVDSAAPDAAQAAVDAAKKENIPVILFNREVDDSVVQSWASCAYVGTDPAEAGHMQGQMIGDYLVKNWEKTDRNGDGSISYVLFKGQEGNIEAEARTRYSLEDANRILEENGKPALEFYDPMNVQKYLVDTRGAWSAEAANDHMKVILREYNEDNGNPVELVIANNDDMAEGAIAALRDAGFNENKTGAIPVFGVDALASACEKIDLGLMAGTVRQDGRAMASTIAVLVSNLRDGEPLLNDTDDFRMDENAAKLRVPYGLYTG